MSMSHSIDDIFLKTCWVAWSWYVYLNCAIMKYVYLNAARRTQILSSMLDAFPFPIINYSSLDHIYFILFKINHFEMC